MLAKNKTFLRDLVETVVTVLVLVIIIRGVIGEPRWIPSASMRPTLMEGDRVFIEKITKNFGIGEIKRGDILVFYPPFSKLVPGPWASFTRIIGLFDKNEAYIKRVIGLPGDNILVSTDKKTGRSVVKVNGKVIKEDYLYENKTIDCNKEMFCGPFTIPENEYFMLGDNRANSQDGRFWGLLPKERIIGKAVFIFWPVNRMKVFNSHNYQ